VHHKNHKINIFSFKKKLIHSKKNQAELEDIKGNMDVDKFKKHEIFAEMI
jgi:hypothetical protein